MGSKYTSQSASGYNSSPPADTGVQTEANKVKYSTIKTKLADVLKTFIEDVNTALVNYFNVGPNQYTADQTLDGTHNNTFVEVTGSGITLTLTDADTLGKGWFCTIANTGSYSVTVARDTSADTIDGAAVDFTLDPTSSITIFVNAAEDGFITTNGNAALNVDVWTALKNVDIGTQQGVANCICYMSNVGRFASPKLSGSSGQYSYNGRTWVAGTGTASSNWVDIAYAPSLGMAAAIGSSGTDRIQTTADGSTWTVRTPATTNAWQAIDWSETLGLFAAVSNNGTGNRVMTSSNGTSWNSQTSASDSSWKDIVWCAGLGMFIAVHSTGGTSAVMTSTNGTTWNSQTTPDIQLYSIAWSESLGLAIATGAYSGTYYYITSTDGTTWSSRQTYTGVTAPTMTVSINYSEVFKCFIGGVTGGYTLITLDGTNWTSEFIAFTYTKMAEATDRDLVCLVDLAGQTGVPFRT
jgi:hypothetical protein